MAEHPVSLLQPQEGLRYRGDIVEIWGRYRGDIAPSGPAAAAGRPGHARRGRARDRDRDGDRARVGDRYRCRYLRRGGRLRAVGLRMEAVGMHAQGDPAEGLAHVGGGGGAC